MQHQVSCKRSGFSFFSLLRYIHAQNRMDKPRFLGGKSVPRLLKLILYEILFLSQDQQKILFSCINHGLKLIKNYPFEFEKNLGTELKQV